MNTGVKILIGVGIGGLVIFLYFKYKNKSAIKPDPGAGKLTVIGNTVVSGYQVPIVTQTIPVGTVPPIPTTYADGTAVPKTVLEDPEYINAWKKFYGNTIFPPGDPRNTPTASGAMVLGNGTGGFWDPNK